MARPYSDDPANQLLRVRCTADDKAEIRKRADAAGVGLSEYALRCMLPKKKAKADYVRSR